MKTTGLVETIKETKEVFLTSIVVILLNIYLVGYLYEQNLLNLDFTYGYHIIVGMLLVAGLLYSVKLKFIVNRFYKNKAIILICIISGILFLVLGALKVLLSILLLLLSPLYLYIIRKVSLYSSIKKYRIKEIEVKIQKLPDKALKSLLENYKESIDYFMKEEYSLAIIECVKGLETLLKTALAKEIREYVEKRRKEPGFITLMRIFVGKYLTKIPKEDRNRLVKEAREVYEIRSRHAHGREIKPSRTIKEKALEIPLLKGFVEYLEALHVIAYTNELLKLINNAYAKQ